MHQSALCLGAGKAVQSRKPEKLRRKPTFFALLALLALFCKGKQKIIKHLYVIIHLLNKEESLISNIKNVLKWMFTKLQSSK